MMDTSGSDAHAELLYAQNPCTFAYYRPIPPGSAATPHSPRVASLGSLTPPPDPWDLVLSPSNLVLRWPPGRNRMQRREEEVGRSE